MPCLFFMNANAFSIHRRAQHPAFFLQCHFLPCLFKFLAETLSHPWEFPSWLASVTHQHFVRLMSNRGPSIGTENFKPKMGRQPVTYLWFQNGLVPSLKGAFLAKKGHLTRSDVQWRETPADFLGQIWLLEKIRPAPRVVGCCKLFLA
jgi:hypothetical protein